MLAKASRTPKFSVDVPRAHARLESLLAARGIDALCVTAQDAFLSEYTPLANNQRAALSGFTGSTGDGLFLAASSRARAASFPRAFRLFVDGRYHLQADSQCPADAVEVVKLDLGTSVERALLDSLAALPSPSRVAYDARRMALATAQRVRDVCTQKGHTIVALHEDEVTTALDLPGWRTSAPIEPVAPGLTGRAPAETAALLLAQARRAAGNVSSVCVASCASDDAAFLLDARGYHLPHLSSVLAYTFLLPGRLVVFLPPESAAAEMKVASEQAHGAHSLRIEVVRGSLADLAAALRTAQVTHVLYNDAQMNALLPGFLAEVWPSSQGLGGFRAIESLRARKTPEELDCFRDSYLRSSRAIARTLRWAKESVRAHQADAALPLPSETDLAARIEAEYAAEGALELSFNTIAGTGPHGAIIHYGTPSAEAKLLPGEITLLDSGAYYEPGFATDCTRVVYNGDAAALAPQPWQREIHTVTVKAWCRGMRATFPLAESGRALDLEVRSVCRAHGHDYGHGTGHGVGIHVHEPGIRLATASTYAMSENACVSMEPGIYLPGKGGVRIENVVRVEARDARLGLYGFENFIWVGLDWDLMDPDLLDEEEKTWLAAYERRCASLGTTITPCPLLARA